MDDSPVTELSSLNASKLDRVYVDFHQKERVYIHLVLPHIRDGCESYTIAFHREIHRNFWISLSNVFLHRFCFSKARMLVQELSQTDEVPYIEPCILQERQLLLGNIFLHTLNRFFHLSFSPTPFSLLFTIVAHSILPNANLCEEPLSDVQLV
jgi:hypothetical protein